MAVLDRTYDKEEEPASGGEERIRRILLEGLAPADLPPEKVTPEILYHLSPLRENIINWIPFGAGSRVLIAGSGCGAVTGALCGRGLEAVAQDPSLYRCTVQYERFSRYEELRLMAGRLEDMEFPEKFDAAVLTCAPWEAGGFSGEDAWKDLLTCLRKALKPEGRLLWAFPNRFGLRYFAGAPEPASGEAFAGLRGKVPAGEALSFSRGEARELLKACGFGACRFYYPWPDEVYPREIFTEETLVSRRCGRAYGVFGPGRAELFPEAETAAALAEEGAMGALANAFVAEAAAKESQLPAPRVFYAKLNNDRREAFRTGMRICGDLWPDRREAFPLCPSAERHFRAIAERGGAARDFPEKPTAEKRLRDAVKRGDADLAREVFRKIRQAAVSGGKAAPARYETPGFYEWFGSLLPEEEDGAEDTVCICPANVSLAADSLFERGDGKLEPADLEWVADFPVPLAFVLWRAAEDAYARVPGLEALLPKEAWLEGEGISPEEARVFTAWARHFEQQYIGEGGCGKFARPARVSGFTPRKAEQAARELEKKQAELERVASAARAMKAELERMQASPLRRLAGGRKKRGK